MSGYGLFNDLKTTDGKAMFFAIQSAILSYPDDSVRSELQTLVEGISKTQDRAQQCLLVTKGCEIVAKSVKFTNYCVWDYSLVPKVSKTEFNSWVDGIQDTIGTTDEYGTPMTTSEPSHFVVTLVILSNHGSLKTWLEYLELKSPRDLFTRESIQQQWSRFARPDSKVLYNSINVLFAITPRPKDRYYTATQLRSDDWDYLRPIY